MDTQQIVETRLIQVGDDQVLTVEMTQPFIDHLRQHFGLLGEQRLEDDQVKTYVLGALDSAVVKAEQEVKNVQPAAGAPRVRRPRRREKSSRS